MSPEFRLYRAAGVADGAGLEAAPGAVLVELGVGDIPAARVLAAGRCEEVEHHPASASAQRLDLPKSILIPGLVNAHAHLDLTHIGPRPFDAAAGFAPWAKMIIAERLPGGDALRTSVEDGVRRSLAGGVIAVGDIAGVMRPEPVRALQASQLLGVSFIEYFGLGNRQEATITAVGALLNELSGGGLPSPPAVRVGLQPHAPYTAGLRVFEWTARQPVPICTHLAESSAERDFITSGSGSFRHLLESLGLWNESILEEVGGRQHPILHLAESLPRAPWLLAHVNDCPDEALAILAATNCSIAYCPRSSAYFRNHESFGPHRYRDMIRAGINVAIGTDSIVNLPANQSGRLSTLDEARSLFARDDTDPSLLLRMITINGARALGLDTQWFTLGGGVHPLAGLVAVDVGDSRRDAPLPARLFLSQAPPKLLVSPRGYL